MIILPKKIKHALAGTLYGAMVALPAVADDIEIYKTSGSTTATTQANLLFVLDTSGSMSSTVQERAPYNPSSSYAGGSGCYDEDQVYAIISPYSFLYAGSSGVTNAEVLCSFTFGSGTFNYYTRRFNSTAVVCDAASSLDTIGFFTGRISQYRNDNWDDNLAANDLTAFVECEADSGVHGELSGGAAVYASSNSPPAWSSSSSGEIDWGSDGVSKTLFTGRYLNYIINEPVTSTKQRIDIMKDVMTELVGSVTGVNIGLMRFSRNGSGGMVVTPVKDIGPLTATGSGTQRDDFITELNRMTPSGNTPLSESFYEAVMYMQGNAVDYGDDSTEQAGSYPSVASSQSGGTYISPITHECQKNFVVILTDGDPVSDSLNSTRRGNIGSDVNSSGCAGSSDNCLDEIAKSIGTNDQSSALDGDQIISTYTIGFANANPLLQDTADESFAATGAGERYFADNAISLADNLNKIIVNVFDTDTSFSSPAVSVNAFNRSTHLSDLYFTLFKPALGPHWPGNLKKYKLDFFVDTDDIDKDGDKTERLPFIADASTPTAKDAIDPVTGFFAGGTRSYWSDDPDGKNIDKGGVANEFQNNGVRNVYTFTGAYTENDGVFFPDEEKLTDSDNAVDESNLAITDATDMLDIVGLPGVIAGADLRETVLNWAAGLDVFDLYGTTGTTDDRRLEMGDPLHSQPALVQYGGDEDNPDLVAYVATNDGYLHAIDADDGREIFSFIPRELLANLNTVMDNTASDKTYGLDGDVVAWINDANGDGTISGASEFVYLYITMRRGGNNIYSLDVTNRDKPELRWVIKGGTAGSAYAELGQTWSTVNVEKVKNGTAEKVVLIFGGGYDENQDSVSVRTTDSQGRAIYIADAKTGELMWSAGAGASYDTDVSEMLYSIPARIKPLDMSGDGFIDRLYAADMGGQILRFDIDNSSGQLSSSITGGRIADLADGGVTNARRFYYPPDAAIVANEGKQPYLALAITSGYRAHPNDLDVQDRIYVVKDQNIYNTPATYTTVVETDLYDATLNLAGGDGDETANIDAEDDIDAAEGWYIKLDDGTNTNTWVGEKGLAEVLILEGVIVATTFTPLSAATSTNSCDPQSGFGKVFFVDLFDASPAFPVDTDTRSERHTVLLKGGIPPSPNVIIPKGGEATLCIGTECQQAQLTKGVRKTHWYEVEK